MVTDNSDEVRLNVWFDTVILIMAMISRGISFRCRETQQWNVHDRCWFECEHHLQIGHFPASHVWLRKRASFFPGLPCNCNELAQSLKKHQIIIFPQHITNHCITHYIKHDINHFAGAAVANAAADSLEPKEPFEFLGSGFSLDMTWLGGFLMAGGSPMT